MLSLIVPLLTLAPGSKAVTLKDTSQLDQIGGAKLRDTTYRGKKAVEMTEVDDPKIGDLALLRGLEFHNGVIEVDLTATPTDGSPAGARGFVGVAFRASDDSQSFDSVYLRMTNGRAESQDLRNHSVQYISIPDYPWDRLRKEAPSKYEAYADIQPGVWTHMKINVYGTDAKVWVGDAKQPTMIIHGLLRGDVKGRVGFYIAGYTKARYANLRVTPL